MIVTDSLKNSKLHKESNSLTMEIIRFKCNDISMLGRTRQMAMEEGSNATRLSCEKQHRIQLACTLHIVQCSRLRNCVMHVT